MLLQSASPLPVSTCLVCGDVRVPIGAEGLLLSGKNCCANPMVFQSCFRDPFREYMIGAYTIEQAQQTRSKARVWWTRCQGTLCLGRGGGAFGARYRYSTGFVSLADARTRNMYSYVILGSCRGRTLGACGMWLLVGHPELVASPDSHPFLGTSGSDGLAPSSPTARARASSQCAERFARK